MKVKKKVVKKKRRRVKVTPFKAKEGDKRIGNQFWQLRTKHGVDKLFSSPKILWDEACNYFQWCVDNPLMESVANVYRGEVIITEMPKMRVFTWEGLEFYLGVSSLRWYKTNPSYKDFLQVIGEIEKVIFNQKFSGAASGFFNANIIARDLGLKEQTENVQAIVIPDITPEQRKKLREDFNNKF